MSRSVLVTLFAIIPLYIVSPARAQTPVFDAGFFSVVNAELKEKPHLVLWADAKNLRTSTFYTSTQNTIAGMLTNALAQSKCFKKITLADLDHALLLMSDLDGGGSSERGYIAVNGNLDATNLIKCLAKDQSWTATTLKNHPAYLTSSGTDKSYVYAVGNDTMVIVSATWANHLDPGKNVLGAGKLSGFVKSRMMAVQMEKAPKDTKLKSMVGELKVGTDLEFTGSATYLKEKDALEMQKTADQFKKQGSGAGLTFANTLKLTRTKARLDGTMTMTPAEFVVVMSLLNAAIFGSTPPPTKAAPPKKNNAKP